VSAAAPLDKRTKARILLPFAITALIWGSTWLVIRDQLGTVSALWSVSYRFAIGTVAMLCVALAMRARLAIGWRDQALAAIMGLITFAISYNLVYAAERYVTSGLVAVLFALLVPVNALLGRIFLGQGLSRPFLVGSGIAMLGVILLFAHEFAVADTGRPQTLVGMGYAVLALFFTSAGNVLQGAERAKTLPMPSLLMWSMGWGAVFDAIAAWAIDGPPTFDPRLSYLAGLLYLGIVASAVAFTLYFTLIRQIGPARGGYVNVIVPVVAMSLSSLFEHYRWSPEAAIGGVLILIGLVIALKTRVAE
jgi:drug/metabolite transporter (DMT)-like permease